MPYRLEELELIYTERTNGKFVTNDAKVIEKIKEEYASEIARNYFESMKKIGIDSENAISYINERKEKNNVIRNK